MKTIYLSFSNSITKTLQDKDLNISYMLANKFNIEYEYVPSPLESKKETRDLIQLINTLKDLYEVYEFLKYIKDIFKLYQISKKKYLNIYKKEKNELEAKISLEDEKYLEKIKNVLDDSMDYVFEFVVEE